MTEQVLVISIKPRWVKQILSREKTVELRRRPPRLHKSVSALIYETGPTYRLRAKCRMGPVRSGSIEAIWMLTSCHSCVTRQEYNNYFDGKAHAHAIEITCVVEMPSYFTLAFLREKAEFVVPQSWAWASARVLKALGPFVC
jgi:predicted transcriptional regulator